MGWFDFLGMSSSQPSLNNNTTGLIRRWICEQFAIPNHKFHTVLPRERKKKPTSLCSDPEKYQWSPSWPFKIKQRPGISERSPEAPRHPGDGPLVALVDAEGGLLGPAAWARGLGVLAKHLEFFAWGEKTGSRNLREWRKTQRMNDDEIQKSLASK